MYIRLTCCTCFEDLGYMNINQKVEPGDRLTRTFMNGEEYPILCPKCYKLDEMLEDRLALIRSNKESKLDE